MGEGGAVRVWGYRVWKGRTDVRPVGGCRRQDVVFLL